MYPAGSVVGTALDLHQLMQALLSKDGVPLFEHKTTIDLMFEPTLDYPDTHISRIANGLFSLPAKSQDVYGHGGNSKAFSSSFYVNRKEGIGSLVLINIANETIFTAGIPELIFGEYVHPDNDILLENSSKWAGIYEPARLPRHGFSKIYGLFLRSHTKQEITHDLKINDFYYEQLEPGIYQTNDDFSIYSLDIYSQDENFEKMLSNTYSDLLYVSHHKHLLEWTGILLLFLAIITSFLYVVISLFRKLIGKGDLSLFIFTQHTLNLLLFTNICWIIYKTLSMVSYSDLKPFLFLNILYIVLSFLITGILIIKGYINRQLNCKKPILLITIVLTFILCINILYWEFYY